MVWTLTIGSLKNFLNINLTNLNYLSLPLRVNEKSTCGAFTPSAAQNSFWTFIHFSCVAKRRISFSKESKLRHFRDRRRKDINRKKNLEGKAIEHLHLFQE